MQIEKQVVSLELAKKLKELGVKQESLFWWNDGDGRECIIEYIPEMSSQTTKELNSAFTVAELGEMLPNGLNIMISTTKAMNKWICYAEEIKGALRQETHRVFEDTEADARAKMLIYLLENNLINKE